MSSPRCASARFENSLLHPWAIAFGKVFSDSMR